jgi:MFS family permease
MSAPPPATPLVIALGTTQTLSWASSYYLPAILAVPASRELGLSPETFFAAFSLALVLSAFLGPAVGRAVDRAGGRDILCASNLILAAGLVALSQCGSVWTLFLAWTLLGLGMGMGLYDTAFAALVRIYGTQARASITGITLLAGFASTVGWPLSGWAEATWGWREACLMWAGIHVFVSLPLNLLMLPKVRTAATATPVPGDPQDAGPEGETHAQSQPWGLMALLAFVFAATWFVTGALATHLPQLLQAAGATPAQAIAYAALMGPAQVAARLAEFVLLSKVHPVVTTRIAAAMHPLGCLLLLLLGPAAMALFTVLHGGGNGLLTVAKGTLPLALLGPKDYGYRQGLIGAPGRFAQAIAPLLFGFLVTRYGAGALIFSAVLSLSAFVALWFVSRVPERQ